MYQRMSNYDVGSEVQQRDGHIRIKLADGTWTTRARAIASNTILRRDLAANERVYRIDNTDPADDRPQNLVVIKHRTTKWRMLAHSKPIYVPSQDKKQRTA